MPPAGRAPWALLGTFCAIWCGLVFSENITDNVLPLTLGRYTTDASIIGLILATKPLFGFLAQPLIGIWSDRIWTRFGRRALFLLVCAPSVALCLVLIPFTSAFWQIVLAVVAFQFFQDVAWGSDHPLMADLVPVQHRTLLMGMIMTANQVMTFVFLNLGMGWCMQRFGEPSIYWLGAVAQILFVAGAALRLRRHERPPVPQPRSPLTFRRYLRDIWDEPTLRKFAALAFFQGMGKFIVLAFVVIFATRTVGISRADYGKAWSIQPLIAPIMAIPIGIAVERFCSKRWTLVFAYALSFAGCVWGLFASGVADFVAITLLFGTGMMIAEITQKPFFTEFLPKDIIGQLSGAYNICFAAGRTLATAGGGILISLCGNNYRVIFLPGAVFVLIAAFISANIADPRHAQRQRVNPT